MSTRSEADSPGPSLAPVSTSSVAPFRAAATVEALGNPSAALRNLAKASRLTRRLLRTVVESPRLLHRSIPSVKTTTRGSAQTYDLFGPRPAVTSAAPAKRHPGARSLREPRSHSSTRAARGRLLDGGRRLGPSLLVGRGVFGRAHGIGARTWSGPDPLQVARVETSPAVCNSFTDNRPAALYARIRSGRFPFVRRCACGTGEPHLRICA